MTGSISNSLAILHRVTHEFGWGRRDEVLAQLNTCGRLLKRAQRYELWDAILDLSQGNMEHLVHYCQLADTQADTIFSLLEYRK